MSLIGLSMDLLLACLLVAALMYGVRLERKLKALRDSQAGFAEAVIALDVAARRAETGIETLKAASVEAHDELHDRILRARELKQELDKLIVRAERAVEAGPAARTPEPAAADPVRARLQPTSIAAMARSAPAAPAAKPGAARNLDEDLFETSSPGTRR